MPRLPRIWIRDAANILATRDGTLFLAPTIPPGVTVARIHFTWQIFGYVSESDLADTFDAYYVGISTQERFADPANLNAYADRNSVDWQWWKGAHFRPVFGVGTPGRAWLFYGGDDAVVDVKAQRTYSGTDQGAVCFSFARSGGAALGDERVNVAASILTLG